VPTKPAALAQPGEQAASIGVRQASPVRREMRTHVIVCRFPRELRTWVCHLEQCSVVVHCQCICSSRLHSALGTGLVPARVSLHHGVLASNGGAFRRGHRISFFGSFMRLHAFAHAIAAALLSAADWQQKQLRSGRLEWRYAGTADPTRRRSTRLLQGRGRCHHRHRRELRGRDQPGRLGVPTTSVCRYQIADKVPRRAAQPAVKRVLMVYERGFSIVR